jgi:hypothetical protein
LPLITALAAPAAGGKVGRALMQQAVQAATGGLAPAVDGAAKAGSRPRACSSDVAAALGLRAMATQDLQGIVHRTSN